jgi:hypothetical protein
MSEQLFGGRIGGRHAVEFGVKTNKVNPFLQIFPFWLKQVTCHLFGPPTDPQKSFVSTVDKRPLKE